jgi:hypothetical protein
LARVKGLQKRVTSPSAGELPLVKRCIAALPEKIEANGCTPGEAAAAFEKAKELVAKYELDPGAFRWPPRPSAPFGSARSGPSASKLPGSATSGRGRSIGKHAEQLIIEHPTRPTGASPRRSTRGSRASEKSSGGTELDAQAWGGGAKSDGRSRHEEMMLAAPRL